MGECCIDIDYNDDDNDYNQMYLLSAITHVGVQGHK